jgi:hypothetical protein
VQSELAGLIDNLYEFVSKYYETRKEFLEDLLEEGLKSALGQVRLRMQDWIGMSAPRLRAMGLFISRSFVLRRGRCR